MTLPIAAAAAPLGACLHYGLPAWRALHDLWPRALGSAVRRAGEIARRRKSRAKGPQSKAQHA